MKPKHETKNCQRCGKGLECKFGSILTNNTGQATINSRRTHGAT